MQSLGRIASTKAIQVSLSQFSHIVETLVQVCNSADAQDHTLVDSLVQLLVAIVQNESRSYPRVKRLLANLMRAGVLHPSGGLLSRLSRWQENNSQSNQLLLTLLMHFALLDATVVQLSVRGAAESSTVHASGLLCEWGTTAALERGQTVVVQAASSEVVFLSSVDTRPDMSDQDTGEWAGRELTETRNLVRAMQQRHLKRGLAELELAVVGASQNGVFVARDVLTDDLWGFPTVLVPETDARQLEVLALSLIHI
eukprot:TRINITY_DN14249_c0_g2_i1.p1 TRINITY_DN14249_c0_g2~~TRINITY_DN14249_c0_g2_i1.p1  ORF type:complete len:255 (+),score=93.31 TRINITY_DN14249_c0_g2_i1:123-887(+)